MLNFDWGSISGEGWKVFIVYGPIPGESCTTTQFVQENTYQRNILTGYTACSAPHLETNNGNPPMLLEQGDYNCPYGTNYATDPNCFQYPANTWITEYWKVTLGTFGQPSTHFEAWAGVQGKPLKKWIDLPNFKFGDPADSNSGLMRILLTPYFSGATAATTNPAAAMWFDELIVSTQPIATPADNSGTPPPPSPCDVNGDGATNVADVQLEVNMALGISSCTNPGGTCTVVSVQRVVNAALGGTCVAP
jgi:hypothetical protein